MQCRVLIAETLSQSEFPKVSKSEEEVDFMMESLCLLSQTCPEQTNPFHSEKENPDCHSPGAKEN